MAFPEKVTYSNKYNLRPIVDPDGQFSAENANHIKEKINKNALFHGVHDNLAALQAAHTNPTVGAFAYLIDGSHYRCVNIGWTTNEAGGGGNYFYGYHPSPEALKLAHPNALPGARAIIKVEGANDLEALWDEDAQDWFWFDFAVLGISTDQGQLLQLGQDGKLLLTKEMLPDLGVGSPETLPSGFKVENFSNGYQGGLNWKPFAKYSFDSNSFTVTANITIDTSTIPAGQKILAALVLNSNGTITLLEGEPSVNPSAPNLIDPAIQMIPPGGLILLSSGANAPEEISLKKIYTNNSGVAGGEWTATVITGGARWNLASNEGDGIVIKGNTLQANDQLKLVPGAAIPIGDFTELVFKIHNLVDTGLTSGGGGFRFIVFGNYVDNRGRVRNSNVLLPSLDTGGYDVTSLQEQFVSLKVQSLSFYEITELRFVFDHADPAVIPTILLDEIKYNDGTAPSGENFATVGYVDRKTQETLDASKTYTDEASKWKGSFLNVTALNTAYPVGQEGWTADVDAGVGDTVKRYVWDVSDAIWQIQIGESTAETAASVRTKYLSNTGTEELTTILKSLYNTASTWVTTNGQNVLDRLGVLEINQVTKTAAVSFNTEALSDGGYSQNGKNVVIQNGTNAINITVGATANGVYSFQKEGTGAITFLASAGKTRRDVDGTNVMDGAIGSTATVSVVGTIVSIRISNAV